MVRLLLLWLVNFSATISLIMDIEGYSILRAFPIALIFSVLSVGLMLRAKLLYFILYDRGVFTSWGRINSYLLIPITTFCLFVIPFYGFDVLEYWWGGVIYVLLGIDSKHIMAKAAWPPSPSLLRSYQGINNTSDASKKFIDHELMIAHLIPLLPLVFYFFVAIYKGTLK